MSLTCMRCGSDKVIPDVPLFDSYGPSSISRKPLGVEVQGRPDAWFLKDPVGGNLVARVCGECGHTELHTTNFRALYEKYQQPRQQ
jgi:hypothetical protein